MKAIFIINPISGTGRQSTNKFLIKNQINKSRDYQIIETEYDYVKLNKELNIQINPMSLKVLIPN